jgi:transposase
MKERVTLTKKEQKRLMVLNGIERGELTCGQGAELFGLSLRHLRRMLARYRKEGAAALAHGNRGRKPHHATAEDIKGQVVTLVQTTYAGCNHQHLTELLYEREGIRLSRSTVRRILLKAGIRSPRKRRPPKHRSRRERYPREGMLLQIDASRDDWLERRGPYLSLVGAIDDATGKVPYALFRDEEDAQGYTLLLRHIVENEGIPEALYHDGHGIFERSRKEAKTLEEQLAGRRKPTQFGRMMEELGIISITSPSPQARGRIERLWGTFQDRLKSELRIAGAKSSEEANRVLWDFLPRFNQRFVVAAREPGLAYGQVPDGFKPDEIFCFKYERTVGRDNVVCFGKHRLQIMPTNGRLSYVKARVEVHERMDGSLAVYYKRQCLFTRSAPPEAPVLRARSTARFIPGASDSPELALCIAAKTTKTRLGRAYKPAPDHPWRRTFKVHIDRG